MSKKKLFIVGSGSVGGFIVNNCQELKETYEIAGFLDDDSHKIGKEFFGYMVLGNLSVLADPIEDVAVIVSIANPASKTLIVERLTSPKIEFPSFISKMAWISNHVKIGKGSIIYPGVSINYNTEIQDFVICNMNCAIGHDCKISSYSTLAPGVSLGGFTSLERGVDMGINSATKQGVTVGQQSVVGGMGMVINDIPSDCVAVGVPAKVKR